MLFSSLTFLFLFLPLILLLYFIIPNRTYRNIILMLSSLLFYAWGEPKYIFLMIFSILNDYLHSIFIEKNKANGKNTKAKILLISSILINLGMLLFFKYSDFLIENLNLLFSSNITLLNIALPIGISFYTFQTMSYTIDVYLGKIKAQKNILTLGTYVALFPQLIAGPIVRYSTIENELIGRKENLSNFLEGFKRFFIGLSKKVIIANQMALIADTIYSQNINNLGSNILWLAAIAYTFQIYFDFSGYSDMAIGLGKIFGFSFLENFNFPYIAKSITDFWRRWHISLSSWFRDYVYIPLGGNRVKFKRQIINIMVVWVLTGIWHGAAWNFLLWGVYYGILLIIEKYFLSKVSSKIPGIIKWMCTMLFVIIGWVLFRVEGLTNVTVAIARMFSAKPESFSKYFLENYNLIYSLWFFIPAIIFSSPILKRNIETKKENKWILLIYNFFIIIVSIISIAFLLSSSYNPFIYFRF